MPQKTIEECSAHHQECINDVMSLEAEYSDISRDYEIINCQQQVAILELEKKYPNKGVIAEIELLDILASYLQERVTVDKKAQAYFKKQITANQQLSNAKSHLAKALKDSLSQTPQMH